MKFLLIFISFFIVLYVISFNSDHHFPKKDESKQYEWAAKNKIIAHAMGGIKGKRYTNSIDALELNYENGHRIFEVDLILTSDKKIVARHDWHQFSYYTLEQKPPNHSAYLPLSYKQFKSLPINNKFSPTDLHDIILALQKYEDLFIIADIKANDNEEYELLLSKMIEQIKSTDEKLLDRVIIQFYNREQYEQLQHIYPFKSFIYTLYKSNESDANILKFLKNNKRIKVVSMPKERFSTYFIHELNKAGIYTFVHTINHVEYAYYLLDQGVHGIFSDFISPHALKGNYLYK
jgi:glycerophosphoryl diester phosphodiesterase